MADPTSKVELTEIRDIVCYHGGHGRSYDQLAWDSDTRYRIDQAIKSGTSRFFYTPEFITPQGKRISHEWSFMRQPLHMETTAPYTTGTIEVVDGVVTLTDGTFPSWAAQGDISVTGGVYDVDTRDGDTQVTLEDTSVDVDAGTSYSLRQRWYDLPDDFGFIDEPLNYERYHAYDPVQKISRAMIRQLRQMNYDTYRPKYYHVLAKAQDGSATQKSEMEFYPVADQAYLFESTYSILIDFLTTSAAYPLGNAAHRECLIESCLAAYDRRYGQQDVDHESQFQTLLQSAINDDLTNNTPNKLGRNSDRYAATGRMLNGPQRGAYRQDLGYYVTVGGVIPDSDP